MDALEPAVVRTEAAVGRSIWRVYKAPVVRFLLPTAAARSGGSVSSRCRYELEPIQPHRGLGTGRTRRSPPRWHGLRNKIPGWQTEQRTWNRRTRRSPPRWHGLRTRFPVGRPNRGPGTGERDAYHPGGTVYGTRFPVGGNGTTATPDQLLAGQSGKPIVEFEPAQWHR